MVWRTPSTAARPQGSSATPRGVPTSAATSSSPSADVFVRWSQFGAVSPVFEIGGTGLNATPWKLGAAAMNGLRAAAILHYELFPYHYELARRAASTGVPILRPLALQYPTDERSWAADTELLVGPDLLAAPVTRPGSIADVYLPPGRWVDLGTGRVRQGPDRTSQADAARDASALPPRGGSDPVQPPRAGYLATRLGAERSVQGGSRRLARRARGPSQPRARRSSTARSRRR